jgi:GNAT superfamily N-acetyltransferase
VIIRKIRPTEGAQLRSIRLQAIADSPSAFGSTLPETKALSSEAWDARAVGNAAGDTAIMYVAEEQGMWVGLAGGMIAHDTGARGVLLFSMWVNPKHRRQGLGRELVRRIIEWSSMRGADQIELWVTQTNKAAQELYKSCGFTASAETKPLPSDPALLEQRMVQDLSARCT